MDELLLGSLLPGAVPIHNNNINPVWRGNVQLSDRRRTMYVKAVDSRTLAVEVICAVMGRSLGLPIPRPAIVNVTPIALPDLQAPALFFGSESVDNPDLKKWLNRDSEDTMQALRSWSKLLDAGCFDEWLANADRHGGNILWGGGNNYSLIDHSEALPAWLPVSAAAESNSLLWAAAEGKRPKEIEQLYLKAKQGTQAYSHLSIQSEIRDILNGVSSTSTVDTLIAFLHHRIHSLLMLISRRIGYAQNNLVLQR